MRDYGMHLPSLQRMISGCVSVRAAQALLLSLLGLCLWLVVEITDNTSTTWMRRKLAVAMLSPLARDPKRVQVKPKRPVMHTFFEVVPTLANGEKGTGMTEEADARMLELWKEKWDRAGWEPRVLTLHDAKQHPDYDAYRSKLDHVPLWGQKRAGVNRLYNQYCYLRWLAMAAAGGGWMSDYDVFPIGQIDPSIHSFTVYSGGRQGRGIPCLMSGPPDEWEQMAFAILNNGRTHSQEDLWSDMAALMDIKTTRPYACNSTVVDGAKLLTGRPFSQDDCNYFSSFTAVHFSHNTIQRGVLLQGERFRDRPCIARSVLAHLDRQCRSL